MKSVMFVCTANMCRSPMAEGLMRQQVEQRGEAGDWRIGSAGAAALDGQAATPETVQVAAERGIDLKSHRSRATTRERLEPFPLILVMEQRHKDFLQAEYPDLAGRVRLLTEMVGEATDIWDPVGTGIENYRAMADQVTELIERGQAQINQLAAPQWTSGAADN